MASVVASLLNGSHTGTLRTLRIVWLRWSHHFPDWSGLECIGVYRSMDAPDAATVGLVHSCLDCSGSVYTRIVGWDSSAMLGNMAPAFSLHLVAQTRAVLLRKVALVGKVKERICYSHISPLPHLWDPTNAYFITYFTHSTDWLSTRDDTQTHSVYIS